MLSPKSFGLSALVLTAGLAVAACGQGTEEKAAGNEEPSAETGETSSAPATASHTAATATAEKDEDNASGAEVDVENYTGVYGDPENPGRDFFVAPAKPMPGTEMEIPPGYVMIGAMWGDVAPYYMKPASETRFEQQWVGDFGEQKIVEFELGEDGTAVALTFETVFEDRGRLERLRDLPEKWK